MGRRIVAVSWPIEKPAPIYTDFYGMQALADTTLGKILADFVPKFATETARSEHSITLLFNKKGYTAEFFSIAHEGRYRSLQSRFVAVHVHAANIRIEAHLISGCDGKWHHTRRPGSTHSDEIYAREAFWKLSESLQVEELLRQRRQAADVLLNARSRRVGRK